MLYIGLMSGTSVDGIDAVLASIPAHGRFALVAAHRAAIPAAVRDEIHFLCQPGNGAIERVCALDTTLGELFAGAASAVLKQAGTDKTAVRAIGSHGQTLRHHPQAEQPFTLQVGNPSVIAERTGITTVADFRARDLAAGGQGAPLVPAFHHGLFHSAGTGRAVVNIGGIANVTYLPAGARAAVIGFDTGPGNTLLDQWIRRHRGVDHDTDGRWAASGQASAQLLALLMSDPYFSAAPPKSTGREYFNLSWLEDHLKRLPGNPAPADVQATLVLLTARTIAAAVRGFPAPAREVYICGGGCHNRALMDALAGELAGVQIQTTEALGIHPDLVEAAAFAWLAHRTLEGLPGNLPSVTGAKRAVILGGVYKA